MKRQSPTSLTAEKKIEVCRSDGEVITSVVLDVKTDIHIALMHGSTTIKNAGNTPGHLWTRAILQPHIPTPHITRRIKASLLSLSLVSSV
jgi:hypothetical protein